MRWTVSGKKVVGTEEGGASLRQLSTLHNVPLAGNLGHVQYNISMTVLNQPEEAKSAKISNYVQQYILEVAFRKSSI